jgi:HEPN domain-containing protein
VRHKVAFPKIHDLRELRRLAVAVDPNTDLITDLLIRLAPYAVEFRYPGEAATVEEAKDAVRAVKEIRRFVRSRLELAR